MNKLDFRVACSKALTGLLLVPYALAYYSGRLLTAAAEAMLKANDKVRHWANPDIYGNAPKRARKLFYRRRTVERLAARIEEQDRLINRMSGEQEEVIP